MHCSKKLKKKKKYYSLIKFKFLSLVSLNYSLSLSLSLSLSPASLISSIFSFSFFSFSASLISSLLLGELVDRGGARVNQPSVLVAAGRVVLAGAGWAVLAGRNPISPSPIANLLPKPHHQRVCARFVYVCWVCVCVCAGFVPWVWSDWIVAYRSVAFVDVGRLIVAYGSMVVGSWSVGCCGVLVWLLLWCGGLLALN